MSHPPEEGGVGINIRTVVDVIKQFLEEIWKFEISPKAKTARIGYFKEINSF